MDLVIDGISVSAKPGQTLLELVRLLNLNTKKLSTEPLAAKIAGEVFTLNYVPVRKSAAGEERQSMRRAMEASGGEISLLRYCDPTGKDVYVRTMLFVTFLALEQLYPDAVAKVNHTVGSGLFVSVDGADQFSVDALKDQIRLLVEQDIPLIRRRISTKEAIRYYERRGQRDKARLLSWRESEEFDIYCHEDFADYLYGEMAPSTGYLRVWDLLPAKGGFVIVFPDDQNPEQVADYREMPHFSSVYSEGKQWSKLMECETVADLNDLVRNGKIRQLIRVNEALHEKRYSQVADMICQRNARVVLLSGPSSSGKTTSANRLATQLRVHGKKPILMSLDDYYRNRDDILPGPDGKVDLEHINTIDTDLFAQHIGALLDGAQVEIPAFNFKTGKREWNDHYMKLEKDSVVIVEGLHALNPVLLPQGVNMDQVFRLYISPLLPLNLDHHNRIPSSYLRLLRRTVRDYENRGATVQHTMSMWDSVRRGEKRWIFPFQENADVIFNSSTLYELSVLKKHIYPLLTAVPPEDPCYDDVRTIVRILNYIQEADVDDEIPPTSLVREFIGGNSFYR